MKRIVTLLIYVSLGFVVYKLISTDYLVRPRIHSFTCLALSLASLFAGFLLQALSWKSALNAFGMRIGYAEAIASIGMTVFTKYIPGKVWMITGRAAYLSEYTDNGFKQATFVSAYAQLLSVWTGLTLSLLILVDQEKLDLWWAAILVPWIGTGIVLYSKWLYKGGAWTLSFFTKRDISFPVPELVVIFRILPWFLLTWLFWSLGFGMLAISLVEAPISISVSLAFPLAATLGILAYISPGGLGVREGVLVAYLENVGITLMQATNIALLARIWFLAGEVFIFVIALLCHRYIRKKSYM